jgi:hypothetical protein
MTTIPTRKRAAGITSESTAGNAATPLASTTAPADSSRTRADVCPECGSLMEPNGRCFVCHTCGFSKCG